MATDQTVQKNTAQKLTPIEIPTDRELTKDDLPSKEQLQALLELKGRRVLIFYAWRCSLRALPRLAGTSEFSEVWGEDSVKHVFAVARVNVLWQNLMRRNQGVHVDFSVLYATADAAAAAAAAAADDSSAAAADAAANVATAVSYNIVGISAFPAPDYAYADAADAAATAAFATAATAAQNLLQVCIQDFNRLINAEDIEAFSNTNDWQLWGPTTPAPIVKLQQKLLQQMESLDLGFLAEDLQQVWSGKLIEQKRFARYAKKLSELVLNDAEILRAIILGKESAEQNPAVRVMLVGPGGAGKSSLRDLIIARETEAIKKATTGIVCKEINSEIISEVHGKTLADINYAGLELSLWDFGGQSIFHNLHRGFMRKENCVYVLVVDSRHEQAPDEWLAQIREHTREYVVAQSDENDRWDRTRSSQTVEVLLVTNCYEGVAQEQNRRRLVREYPDLLTETSFYTFSCIEADEKFSAFLQALISACVDSQHLIPESVFKVITDTREEFGNDYFVKESKLRKKLGMQSNEDEWLRLLNKLEGLGHIVRNDKLNFCLNPDLVVNEAYKVINNDGIRNAGGLIDYVSLDEALEPISDEPDLLRTFLEEQMVMATFSLENRDYCLFPDAALQSEPAIVSELYQQFPDPITIDYPLDTLPVSFKSHFVIKLLDPKENLLGFQIQLSGKSTHIWQDGLLIDMANSDCRILIEYQVARQRMSLKFYHGTLAEFNKPLRTLHDYIATLTRRDRDSLIPFLSGGVANLNHSDIKALFDGINVFKQLTEQGGNVVNNYNFENIQGSQIVTGDGSKAEAKHSFNANDPAQLKDLLLLALNAANKETDGAHESLINEVKGAVEAGKDTLPEGSRFANTLLEKLPTWAQRVGDVQSLVNNIKDILDFSG